MPFRWEVVGGSDKGGILVRAGQDLKSAQEAERLSTGAVVEQLQIAGDRLQYRLIEGTGPRQGWVSIRTGGKDLLVPAQEDAADAKEEEGFDRWQVLGASSDADAAWRGEEETRRLSADRILAAVGSPYAVLGLEPGAGSQSVRRAYHILALLHHPDKGGEELVFKALAEAYRVLTEAKTEEGGWRDLEGQAVGPWPAHAPTAAKGITCMLFDTFGTPPWESRRLYTGSWQEANVRCWELSKGEPGKVRPPPRLVGEIEVGGFINDIAALSPFGLLTAQSAGMKPQPGESLRTWNLKQTPFRPVKRAKAPNAIADEAPKSALEGGSASGGAAASGALVKKEGEDDEEGLAYVADDASGYLQKSAMVYLHYRGVRAISLWPRPEHRESTPHLAATVSKDVLGVSKIGIDGCSLQSPAVWQIHDPHGMTDVNALKHETINRMWTGDNSGLVKCWDITTTSNKGCIVEINSHAGGWLSALELWSEPGVMVCSHSSGMAFVDIKAGKMIRNQYTKEAVGKVSILNGSSPMLFAGIGGELTQYDTRMFRDSIDDKPKAVAQWSLGSPITAMHCTTTGKGHLLVAAGCINGKVAAFDTT